MLGLGDIALRLNKEKLYISFMTYNFNKTLFIISGIKLVKHWTDYKCCSPSRGNFRDYDFLIP